MNLVSCPWDALTRAPAEFCEESLCGWIRQPGNTWSNIGFLLAGAAILYRARRVGAEHLRGLGYVALATGLGSAFFHASETLIGRFADWAGMYLGASYMLAVNVRRLSGWSPNIIRLFFWGNFLLGMGLMVPSSRHPSVYYIFETTICCGVLPRDRHLRVEPLTPDRVREAEGNEEHVPPPCQRVPERSRGAAVNRGLFLSSRGRRVASHSIRYANCVLRVGGRDSTRSLSGIHFEKWGFRVPP